MKIVELIGGLGNQMFQYAFLEALKEKFPDEEIMSDCSLFRDYKLHNGLAIARIFGIELPQAPLEQIKKMRWYTDRYRLSRILIRLPFQKKTMCVEPLNMRYNDTVLTQPGDRYFSGYWQNHIYFDCIAEKIRQIYKFPDITEPRSKELLQKLGETQNSVAVHIRRGDYVKNWMFQNICTEEYYRKSIARLTLNGRCYTYFLFSDDIPWCRKHIAPMLEHAPHFFVDWNRGADSYVDMQLMSNCRNQILSNSTFSWWSAYLNQSAETIIAPAKWLNLQLAVKLQMPEWVLV